MDDGALLGETIMANKRDEQPVSRSAEQHDVSTLLPMLIGGLALILIGMVAVALLV